MNHNLQPINITHEVDIAIATSEARVLAEAVGFKQAEQYMIATAVSELARNIFHYAKEGKITIKIIEKGTQKGIEIIAQDNGPGIEDIDKAMTDHFSTGDGLGSGLPGVKRLMDEFEISSDSRQGTKVIARKLL